MDFSLWRLVRVWRCGAFEYYFLSRVCVALTTPGWKNVVAQLAEPVDRHTPLNKSRKLFPLNRHVTDITATVVCLQPLMYYVIILFIGGFNLLGPHFLVFTPTRAQAPGWLYKCGIHPWALHHTGKLHTLATPNFLHLPPSSASCQLWLVGITLNSCGYASSRSKLPSILLNPVH